MDVIFEKDGQEYSLKAAAAKVYAETGEIVNPYLHDAEIELEKFGYKVTEARKSLWRRLRYKFRKSIRKALLWIGALERYFR